MSQKEVVGEVAVYSVRIKPLFSDMDRSVGFLLALVTRRLTEPGGEATTIPHLLPILTYA